MLSGHAQLADHNFYAGQPNQKWVIGISYIWTRDGWLYLAVVLDLYSRRVIGWAVSNRMKRDLAIRALEMAIALRHAVHDPCENTHNDDYSRSNHDHKAVTANSFIHSLPSLL